VAEAPADDSSGVQSPAVLPGLTGLRFVLALCVVMYHYGSGVAAGAPYWVANVIHAGFSTVSAFFVLSGFVLAHTYLLEDGSMRGERRAFWAARFARVYPVYVISILLVLPAYVATGQAASLGEAVVAVGASLVGVQAWVPGLAIAVNSAAWSLSVEAFFYLCFPWFAGLFVKTDDRKLALFVIFCLAASLVAPLLLSVSGSTDSRVLEAVRYNPALHVPAFLLGMATHRLWRRHPISPRVAWVAVALIVTIFVNSDRVSYEVLNNGLLLAPFAVLIAALASGATVLARPALVRLGEASYSLYILHLPAGAFLMPLVSDGLGFAPISWAYLVSIVAGCTAISLVAFALVEEPYRKQLRQRLAGARTPARGGVALSPAS